MSNIKSREVLDRVKEWLRDSVEYNQEVVDAESNGEEFTSDDTDDIIIGIHECSVSLLSRIEKWEEEINDKGKTNG